MKKCALPGTSKLGFTDLCSIVVRWKLQRARRAAADPMQDGEWISEVVDDKLYLTKEDFHESVRERYDWLTIGMPNPDDEYQKIMQTGSKALYFAQCRDQNVTWLPLLEKAYAKAHGDYGAIEGGWSVVISIYFSSILTDLTTLTHITRDHACCLHIKTKNPLQKEILIQKLLGLGKMKITL